MIEYLFGAAAILILIRVFLGPSFADRAIAVDALTNVIVFFMVLYAIRTNYPMFLDIGIVIAMLSFAGLLTLAKFVVRKNV
jgi:multicomponent Na+:H+ antiporter subunit F